MLPFVREWDPGGNKLGDWNPSVSHGNHIDQQHKVRTEAWKDHGGMWNDLRSIERGLSIITRAGAWGVGFVGATREVWGELLVYNFIEVLFDVKDLLQQPLENLAGRDWYVSLYVSWCHSLTMICLYVLAQLYPHTSVVIQSLEKGGINVMFLVSATTNYGAQTSLISIWDKFFNIFLPLQQSPGLFSTSEAFMVLLDLSIESSITFLKSVQHQGKGVDYLAWGHTNHCLHSEYEITKRVVHLLYEWLMSFVGDLTRAIENKLLKLHDKEEEKISGFTELGGPNSWLST